MNKRIIIIDYLSVTFSLIVTEVEIEQERSIQTTRLFREYFGLKHYDVEAKNMRQIMRQIILSINIHQYIFMIKCN